jgi:hypothetical protein
VTAIDSGWVRQRLVRSSSSMRRIEDGARTVVGLNRFTGCMSPLATAGGRVLKVDRRPSAAGRALRAHRAPAQHGIRAAFPICVTPHERLASIPASISTPASPPAVGGTLRDRSASCADRDLSRQLQPRQRAPTRGCCGECASSAASGAQPPIGRCGKPGLDGHSNSARQSRSRCAAPAARAWKHLR